MASGVDQSQHDGIPKLEPLKNTAGQEGVSIGSRVRVVEEGVAPSQGVESSGIDTSTIKIDKERLFFKPHPSYQ